MAEVPIPYGERVGQSKLSVARDGSLFLRSMIWTAMTYNPVRIFGFLGLALIAFALLVCVGLVFARLQGTTTLSVAQLALLFLGAVAAFVGVSLFSLGITFNYLIALFYKHPVRQGLFGKPLFNTPLDQCFWWIGGLSCLVGLIAGGITIGLGIRGTGVERLWFYWLISAMFLLIGFQFILSWIILRVLDEIAIRETRITLEMGSAFMELETVIESNFSPSADSPLYWANQANS